MERKEPEATTSDPYVPFREQVQSLCLRLVGCNDEADRAPNL